MTRVTCHVTIMTSKNADDKDTDAFILLYFLTAKQHKKRTIWVRRWLLDRRRQVSNLLVVHFISRLSLETKPRPKSWPTLSIVWRRLNDRSLARAFRLQTAATMKIFLSLDILVKYRPFSRFGRGLCCVGENVIILRCFSTAELIQWVTRCTYSNNPSITAQCRPTNYRTIFLLWYEYLCAF